MTRILIIIIAATSLFVFPEHAGAQTTNDLISEGKALEKLFRDDEALAKYEEVLKTEPNNVEALVRSSALYSLIGKRQTGKEKQRSYYFRGQENARKALKLNTNDAEANFAMAIAMGRLAQISSGEDRIKAVRDIKTYADRCIQLDPRNYKGYHVIGKWHFELSDLSSLERWLVKIAYGELPKSSMDDAVRYYEKSKQLEPGFLLNYLELAKVYKKKDQPDKARLLIEQMLKLPPTSSDDPKIKRLGQELLDDL